MSCYGDCGDGLLNVFHDRTLMEHVSSCSTQLFLLVVKALWARIPLNLLPPIPHSNMSGPPQYSTGSPPLLW